MKEPILEMRNITKTFGRKVANEKVNIKLYEGEIHAILGENGAGKSTLMNVLLGIYKPNSGEIFYKGKKVDITSPHQAVELGIGMVHQHFRLVPTLTAAENIFLYAPKCKTFLNAKAMEEEILRCSKQFNLEVDPSAKVWQLSVGEQQRVEIIKLLYSGAEILILDEPSAVLTAQEAEEMFLILKKMAAEGKSVVVISHKINEVMQFADRVTVLKSGHVEDTMERGDATVERLTTAIVGDRKFEQFENVTGSKKDNVVLRVTDLCAKSDKGVDALKHVSFDICEGELFGIAGVAGNGQKELAEVIAGLRKAVSGNITLYEEDITDLSVKKRIQKKVAFIPEDRRHMGLVAEMTMDENRILKAFNTATFSNKGFLRKKKIADTVDAEIERHDIKIVGKTAPVSLMSGGNQQKLIIAREIGGEPKLIVAAYPSRGLDMGATETVHEILLEQCKKGVAVLMISEELDELFRMADRIGVMCDGEMMAILDKKDADYNLVGKLMAGERYEDQI